MKKALDREFYQMLFRLSVPIALQSVISYSVNLMDTIMLGSLGETAISASALANQLFFIYTIASVGISGSGIVLCCQYWGKGDVAAIRRIIAMTSKAAIGFAAAFTALAMFFPAQIMGIYTSDPVVIAAGVSYLRIVSITYIFYGLSSNFLNILRSVETVKISTYIYCVSFVTNVFFNYLFIFGNWGAPKLGIVGAAIGTLIARLVEFTIVLVYLLAFERKVRFRPHMLRYWDKILLKDMLHYGLPVLFNETLWAVGISIHSIILGHMGSDVVAANSICSVVYQMTTSAILGAANASAVVIGKIIGTRDYAYARTCAYRLRTVYFYIGIGCSAIMLLVRKPVVSLYNVQESTRLLASDLMAVYAVIIFFMAFACSFLMGVFRGSGDTRFALYTDIGCLWSAIPLGLLAAFVFKWPALAVCALLRLDMPLKAILCLLRLRGNKWIKNVTRDEAELTAGSAVK